MPPLACPSQPALVMSGTCETNGQQSMASLLMRVPALVVHSLVYLGTANDLARVYCTSKMFHAPLVFVDVEGPTDDDPSEIAQHRRLMQTGGGAPVISPGEHVDVVGACLRQIAKSLNAGPVGSLEYEIQKDGDEDWASYSAPSSWAAAAAASFSSSSFSYTNIVYVSRPQVTPSLLWDMKRDRFGTEARNHMSAGSQHALFATAKDPPRLYFSGVMPPHQRRFAQCIQYRDTTAEGSTEGQPPVRICGVAAGVDHSLFVDTRGRAYACGAASGGRLGLGWGSLARVGRYCPRPCRIDGGGLSDPIRVRVVTAGGSHSIFLSCSGRAYSCGTGASGALGHGDASDQVEPKRIEALDNVYVQACSAWNHSLFLTADGRVFACGDGRNGRLGIGMPKLRSRVFTPKRITHGGGCGGGSGDGGGGGGFAAKPVVCVAAGSEHSCFVTADGAAYTCGSGASGRLGDGVVSKIHAVHFPTRIDTCWLPRTSTAPPSIGCTAIQFGGQLVDRRITGGGGGEEEGKQPDQAVSAGGTVATAATAHRGEDGEREEEMPEAAAGEQLPAPDRGIEVHGVLSASCGDTHTIFVAQIGHAIGGGSGGSGSGSARALFACGAGGGAMGNPAAPQLVAMPASCSQGLPFLYSDLRVQALPCSVDAPADSVSAGKGFSIIRMEDGRMFSVGTGCDGCLGHGSLNDVNWPVPITQFYDEAQELRPFHW